jgi:hypothetical protein
MVVLRKPQRADLTLEDLVRSGTISRAMATLLATCVTGRANILVTGSLAPGATSFLGALAAAGSTMIASWSCRRTTSSSSTSPTPSRCSSARAARGAARALQAATRATRIASWSARSRATSPQRWSTPSATAWTACSRRRAPPPSVRPSRACTAGHRRHAGRPRRWRPRASGSPRRSIWSSRSRGCGTAVTASCAWRSSRSRAASSSLATSSPSRGAHRRRRRPRGHVLPDRASSRVSSTT